MFRLATQRFLHDEPKNGFKGVGHLQNKKYCIFLLIRHSINLFNESLLDSSKSIVILGCVL